MRHVAAEVVATFLGRVVADSNQVRSLAALVVAVVVASDHVVVVGAANDPSPAVVVVVSSPAVAMTFVAPLVSFHGCRRRSCFPGDADR